MSRPGQAAVPVRSAEYRAPSTSYLLLADSKQNWPGQLGDGALPPERDMKQLGTCSSGTTVRRQVHPVPSRTHNRCQAPSQVLPPIHHRACLPYPTS